LVAQLIAGDQQHGAGLAQGGSRRVAHKRNLVYFPAPA
jgi:hypothetical protein